MGDRLPNHWEKKERMMRAGRLQHVLSGIGKWARCAPLGHIPKDHLLIESVQGIALTNKPSLNF
jgi:hypothetical protein